MGALCSPVAMSTISSQSRMVPTPIVIASWGTLASPKKSLAASLRVISSRITWRVRVCRPEPGSLKPTWPERPMPSSMRSIPPAFSISCSYSTQWRSTASGGMSPRGMWIWSAGMLTWLKKFSSMNRW